MIFKLLASGIFVVDISGMGTWNTSSVVNLEPLIVAELDTPGTTRSITLSSDETRAFIADYGIHYYNKYIIKIDTGMSVIDISGMAGWSTASITNLDTTLVAEWNTLGYMYDVILSNDNSLAYLADSKHN